ncbi:unnamed protein product [Acanthoscelides obtectus]|nr:unnamed protein product [Acanthoscelides obtectus]CAK1639875.1 Bifunctional arginine demethylase and lysyl-hydroxylase JMJD6 [Acanthoscelides obtectus]
MPSVASKAFREPESCEFCEHTKEVDKVTNISPNEFLEFYSKPFRPVVVADGATNWSALQTFSFNFFKELHQKVQLDKSEVKNCQFFPYKTDFKYLSEVFNMSESRANLEPGEKPWYVGWSNCNENSGKVLQQYYSKPYFLGNNSEDIALSWIFMGGPGFGAQMHVDNVHYPSWQAQLKGKKLWRLAPPPECYLSCHKMEVIVEPGEIIAVDTNKWYHQTIVLPGEISITIGAEFD